MPHPLEVLLEPSNTVILPGRDANILHAFPNAAVLIPFSEATVFRIVFADGNYPDMMDACSVIASKQRNSFC